MGQHGHIPTHAAVIIPVVAVHLRVRHVRAVIPGRVPAQAHVQAEQSVSHVMRGIICPTGHVNSAKLDTIVPGTTIAVSVPAQHILGPVNLRAHHVQTVQQDIMDGMEMV